MRFPLYMALCLLLFSCSSGDSTGPPPPEEALPTEIVLDVTSGMGQTDTVTKELGEPIVVLVQDEKTEAPVSGVLVNFVVTGGGGSVFAGSAISNSAGEVRERWTLGTDAGQQTLEARAVDQETGDPITYATITATALPDVPTRILGSDLTLRGVPGQWMSLPHVNIVDQYNNLIKDLAIVWESDDPSAEISGSSIRFASEIWTRAHPLVVGYDRVTSYDVPILVLANLGLYDWTITYACNTTWREDKDSIAVIAQTVKDSSGYTGAGIAGRWWMEGISIQYWADGSVDTLSFSPEVEAGDGIARALLNWEQRPDTLVWVDWIREYNSDFSWPHDAVKDPDSMQYAGGSICPAPNGRYWDEAAMLAATVRFVLATGTEP